MRIAYLDCFSGISGDMLLGALVDAGVPLSLLEETVRNLKVGAEIRATRTTRGGIGATKIDVLVNGRADVPADVHQHGEHTHTHADGTTHSHSHEHEHTHAHRGLREIREIVGEAQISASARKTALRAFELLAAAEAKIHNTDVESVHFHEVGAVDAIVDIVCAAVGADYLGADQWFCSALNVGSGTVECAHGTLPVPAPATLELLREAPIYSGTIAKELVTPTGAALVRALGAKFSALPPIRTTATGYGAGARDFPSAANVLRVTIGEAAGQNDGDDEITVFEANLDDLSPQVFGYVIDRLLDAGALDAFGTAVQMKKSRPGMLLTVLARPADADRLATIIFEETTTLGLRIRREQRQTLAREFEQVETEWGPVRIKVARLNGRVTNFAPEYEDCRQIAAANAVPLKFVLQQANKLYLDRHPLATATADALVERHHG